MPRAFFRLKGLNMSYSQYELLKKEWIAKNPNANSHQYQQAMKEIARKCGV